MHSNDGYGTRKDREEKYEAEREVVTINADAAMSRSDLIDGAKTLRPR
jgi:hypothetical protein